jgi:hypothetical protein
LFCYWFDSSKARKTVLRRRFQALNLLLKKAKRARRRTAHALAVALFLRQRQPDKMPPRVSRALNQRHACHKAGINLDWANRLNLFHGRFMQIGKTALL